MSTRVSSHAGSWYSDNALTLDSQLTTWLKDVTETFAPAKAVIVPRRIFIIGPSHHADLGPKCALSQMSIYQTPLDDLKIDRQVYDELNGTGEFVPLTKAQDEAEHSIEMQLPYIAKVMKHSQCTIVPIVVGSLTPEREAVYGQLLSRYLLDPNTVFVISSDFCHWAHGIFIRNTVNLIDTTNPLLLCSGSRFRYNYYNPEDGEIWQSIEKLDRMGIDVIEQLDPSKFTSYLKEYHNTICGRRAINVLLNAIQAMQKDSNMSECQLRFLNYAQSSRCRSNLDSSVSYAAASLVIR